MSIGVLQHNTAQVVGRLVTIAVRNATSAHLGTSPYIPSIPIASQLFLSSGRWASLFVGVLKHYTAQVVCRAVAMAICIAISAHPQHIPSTSPASLLHSYIALVM